MGGTIVLMATFESDGVLGEHGNVSNQQGKLENVSLDLCCSQITFAASCLCNRHVSKILKSPRRVTGVLWPLEKASIQAALHSVLQDGLSGNKAADIHRVPR